MSGRKLRLIFPQWQGGNPIYIPAALNQFSRKEASHCYYYGSHILNMLVPPPNGEDIAEVPISLDFDLEGDLKIVDGIYAKEACVRNLKAAYDILSKKNPDHIVTIGGECSVSLAPFTYLASKYGDDVAIVWIDAHPDNCLPHDYENEELGFHGMPVSHIFGMGDKDVLSLTPAHVKPEKLCYIGVRMMTEKQRIRMNEMNLKNFPAQEARENPSAIIEWLKSTKCSKVMIHLDLDALEPTELIAGVAHDPDGVRLAEVTQYIKDISEVCDVVAFTVAEHAPAVEMSMRLLLKSLPIFQ